MSQISLAANWLLRLPLLWGVLASLAFYAAVKNTVLGTPLVVRYFDSHQVEWASTLLFFVGVSALAIRLLGLLGQFSVLKSNPLGEAPASGQPVADAPMLIARLDAMSDTMRGTRLVKRLRAALTYVEETGSADTLEQHLERLEQSEYEQISSGYALPRLVRATLPIVGMLGTVIGITMAIGQLSPEQLEESLTGVMGALSIAFDTTAQAMSLMLVLWFAMFGVEQVEQSLLRGVDEAANRILLGRFQQYGAATDPGVASIRRMGEQVIDAVDQLSAKQANTLRETIQATHEEWSLATDGAGERLTEAVRDGLKESLSEHARLLNQGAETQAESARAAIDAQLQAIEQQTDAHAERLSTSATKMLGNLGDGLERMAELLVEALQRHGETLTQAEQELAAENRRHLTEVEAALGESMVVSADRQEKLVQRSERLLGEIQRALVDAAGATVEHQEQLVKQGEVLLRVVESTGQIKQLEHTLNQNLASLSQTHNFEATLLSLSAAVQLLSARIGRGQDGSTPGRAA